MKRFRQGFRTALLMVLVLMVAAETRPFVRDTHYYLGFAAALATCFDWDEAHLIASANLMVDGNTSTRAEWNPLKKHAKTKWHAFGHSKERYNELWYRVLDEKDPNKQLILFGQFLHFLQDWESHAGFSRSLGHASATILGKDPDSMARDRQRTISALQATLDHMTQEDLQDLEEEYLPILEEMDEVGEDEPIEVGLIGPPKLWFNPNDWLCASILVGTSDKDPTHVLDPIEFSIGSADGEATSLTGIGERRWSITATGRTTPPAAKTYECFTPAELCPLIVDKPSSALLIHAEAGAGEQEVSVPFEGPLGENLQQICAEME